MFMVLDSGGSSSGKLILLLFLFRTTAVSVVSSSLSSRLLVLVRPCLRFGVRKSRANTHDARFGRRLGW